MHKAEPTSSSQTPNSSPPKRTEATQPLLIELSEETAQKITKERVTKPDETPEPSVAEIAAWTPPTGPKFEVVFQHRVKRGGPVFAHPDGKSFIHMGNRLARWALGDDKPQTIYHESSTSRITDVAILKSQNGLLAGDDQGILRVWSMDSGELSATRKFEKRKSGILAVAATPHTETIAAVTGYRIVKFFDSKLRPKEIPEIRVGNGRLFFLDERLLVVMGEGTEVWDIETSERIDRLSSKSLSHGPPIMPDGVSFAYQTLDGLKQWKRSEPDSLLETPTDGDSQNSVLYSPDGKLLAQASSAHVEIIDVAFRQRRQIWDAPRMAGICWMPDSNLFVTTTEKGLVSIVGLPKSARRYGLTPIASKSVAPHADKLLPPTSAQLQAIIDLRTLPKLPRFPPTTDYYKGIWYQTPIDVRTVRKFYRHVLGVRGWKEVATKQQGLFNSNLRFKKEERVLILQASQRRRNRTQPMNLVGTQPGERYVVDENKVTDVSLVLTDYLDMHSLPIHDIDSWELIDDEIHRLRFRTNKQTVACELQLLRTLPSAGWAFVDNISSSPLNTRFLKFAKNGCTIDFSIGPDRTNPNLTEVEAICRDVISMPVPPDSAYLSWKVLKTAQSQLGLSDLRANFDSQMKANGWFPERVDADNLHRTIYTKELQEVAYRFEMHERQSVVTMEPDREFVWQLGKGLEAEVPAAAFPTPGAVTPPPHLRALDGTKTVEFVTNRNWAQLRTSYVKFLNERGYQCKSGKK